MPFPARRSRPTPCRSEAFDARVVAARDDLAILARLGDLFGALRDVAVPLRPTPMADLPGRPERRPDRPTPAPGPGPLPLPLPIEPGTHPDRRAISSGV